MSFATHDVLNQPPALVDYNLFSSDGALADAVRREAAGWAEGKLTSFGQVLGRSETIEWGFQANLHPPILQAFDRYGGRRDTVEFHPAYHSLMELAIGEGLHCSPWSEPQPGAHVARAAQTYMLGQIEPGVLCPITMTYAVVPTLKREPSIAREWLPRLFSRQYDPRFLSISKKTGVMMGMGMTEKQGGSDLRVNTTSATPTNAAPT